MGAGASKDTLEGTSVSLKPLRTDPILQRTKTTTPINKDYPKKGTIDFLAVNPTMMNMAGYFSFTIYTNKSIDEFLLTSYYLGLMLYAEIIHTQEYFKDTAMLLYTDNRSINVLQNTLGMYPKVIFCVVNWPTFKIDNSIEDTVLRCMRFHAIEAFPQAWICIRDADTLYVREIMTANEAYTKGYKGHTPEGQEVEDYRPFLIQKIGGWETEFIKMWLEEGSPLNFGVNVGYLHTWHMEVPLMYPRRVMPITDPRQNIRGPKDVTIHPSTETGGRFRNFNVSMKAPKGVYAGFSNFSNKRSKDLWSGAYEYITSHYLIINTIYNNEKMQQISNYGVVEPMYIGKDERIILFVFIAHYFDDCYFFSTEYSGGSLIYNSSKKDVPTTRCARSRELLKFGIANLIKEKEIDINIDTSLLTPTYVSDIYTKLCIPDNDDDDDDKPYITINKYFQHIFRDFSRKYRKWIREFMAIPEEDMKKRITAMISAQRITGKPDDYVALTPKNFNSNVYRIHPQKPYYLIVPMLDDAKEQREEREKQLLDRFNKFEETMATKHLESITFTPEQEQIITRYNQLKESVSKGANIGPQLDELIREGKNIFKESPLQNIFNISYGGGRRRTRRHRKVGTRRQKR